MPRYRVRYLNRYMARPALVVRDTPRPGCGRCHGKGGWTESYGGPDGEFAGEESVDCDCWDPMAIRRVRLPLPMFVNRLAVRLAARRDRYPFADRSPF